MRKDAGHLRTTIDQITEKLRSELAKLNPAITPNPKSEEIKPSNNQKTTEISTTLTSSAISLSQLSPKFIDAKNKSSLSIINWSQFERSYLSIVLIVMPIQLEHELVLSHKTVLEHVERIWHLIGRLNKCP